ncbi:MAG TPA: hypothetical protein DDX40_00345 [Rikenellaceae bacterium]|nr:hypothetical protein [Rikenellaceae bacterium]
MKRFVYGLSLFCAAMITIAATGQQAPQGKGMLIRSEDSFLEPLQKRDSALIGDQFRYGFHLKDVAEGTRFALPDFSRGFMDSVEIVFPFMADTVKIHGKKNEPKSYDIDVSMIITSFDEGEYELLPLSLIRASGVDRIDTLVFASKTLDIFTMPVDTTTYQIHDIKGQIRYPLKASEVIPYVLGIWGVAIVVILIWAMLAMRRKNDKGAITHKDPPYLVALRRLDRFRGSKYWAPEKQKAYYSGITDALREYIDARYGIDAMEMTTAEIFKDLKSSGVPADLYEEMKTLFETADFVKFAKASASDEENAAALPAAVRFVTVTYQSQLAEEEAARKAAEAKSSAKKEGGEA